MALYGTSEKRLEISRGIHKIRDFMIPDTTKINTYSFKYKHIVEEKECCHSKPDKLMVEVDS